MKTNKILTNQFQKTMRRLFCALLFALAFTCAAPAVSHAESVSWGTPATSKSTKKTTKTSVKKLTAKATKTRTKKTVKKVTKPSSAKISSDGKTKTVTQKVITTTTTTKYTKGSKKAKVTIVTKTVTTKKVYKAVASSGTVSSSVGATVSQKSASATATAPYTVSVEKIAPKVDTRVAKAFKAMNFTIMVDGSVSYGGYFSARNQSITMREESDTVYHELGHFVAFAAGNVDTKADFTAIYEEEKAKFTGSRRVYAAQNASEFFAETFREYTLRPAELKSCCPKTYAAITAALDKVTDEQVAKMNAIFGAIWNKQS